jgi:squalene cyclase
MRSAIILVILASLTSIGLVAARPPVKDKDKDKVKMPEKARKATARGLAWLATKQNTDGSWSDSRYPHNPAITAYALLAFLSQGHLPNQGTYGKHIARGARYLISCGTKDGYLIGTRGGNMYSHAMATLALAELWGLTSDKEIKPVLKKAVDLIITSQGRQGGWRYSPRPSDADISVTVMQVMALRASKNAGITVKQEVIDRAIDYIWTCHDGRSGGFTYQSRNRAPGFARTAAGLCVLYLTGESETKDREKKQKLKDAVTYLKDHFDQQHHYWYGHYYASHAMHQVGGEEWKAWYGKMVDKFVPMQKEDGTWQSNQAGSPGIVFQTSIAIIGLSVPMHCLPIFQR